MNNKNGYDSHALMINSDVPSNESAVPINENQSYVQYGKVYSWNNTKQKRRNTWKAHAPPIYANHRENT